LEQDVARTDLEAAAVRTGLVFDDGRLEDRGRGRALQGDGAAARGRVVGQGDLAEEGRGAVEQECPAIGGRVAGQGRFEQVEPAGSVVSYSCNSDSSGDVPT